MKILACVFMVTVSILSSVLYKHTGRKYRSGKSRPIGSLHSFAIIYRWVQISTPVVFITAVLKKDFIGNIWHSNTAIALGLNIAFLGIIVFILAKKNLGKSYSPCYDSWVPTDLVVSGIYRFIRHPIYTGNLLLLIGLFIASGQLLIFVNFILVCIFYFISATTEEKALSEVFPTYAKYLKSSGMFFPRLRTPIS